MRNIFRAAFVFTISLLILCVGTASAELVIDQNYQLVSSIRVGRTAYDYTYQVNITNNGSDVQNVTAAVSSGSLNTTIIDGGVNFGEVAAGSTVAGTDTFTIRQNRRYAFDPTALSWEVQFTEPPSTSIMIEGGLSVINIPLGASGYIAFTVDFDTNNSDTYSIGFTQSVSQAGGISLNNYPSGWSANSPQTWVVNETITGNAVGTYELTTTVTINETGDTDQITTIVNVISGQENPVLNKLGSNPDAIPVSVPEDVLFTTMITGSSLQPSEIIIEETNIFGNSINTLGELVDDGLSGDLLSDDNVYSGTFNINSDTEGEIYFQVKATFPGILAPMYSDVYKLGVTRFPTDIQASDMSKVVTDPNTGEEIISNEILVSFVEGTNSDDIESVVSDVGGNIVGTIFGLGIYQVEIPDTGDATGVNNTINHVINNHEVTAAEPVVIDTITEVIPNDTRYNNQWGLTQIRADEAWVISRGGVTIAVLDTGVDYNHTDLDSKVIKGRNYIAAWWEPWNWWDPMDDHGHGTHVSGIASAETNNSAGVAGVSWDSKILAVKICNSLGQCPTTAQIKGLKYAADKGAKIINLSLGGYTFSTQVRDAVNYAASKGALVVAAAGNDNCSSTHYPAGYINAIAVGAIDQADQKSIWIPNRPQCTRNSGSNFGNWVNIAAPGTAILSSIPNDNYASWPGTSMATPFVSGSAAVVWAQHPSWTKSQVRQRLEQTAKPLPGQQLGAGRLDLFEAVFNGSFEIGDLSEWTTSGTASSLTSLGPLVPVDRNGHKNRMGYVSTGPADNYVTSKLSQTFTVQSGVTSIPVNFDYNFVTEEYPEWVGSVYDDKLIISLKTPSGNVVELAKETINTSSFTLVGGIDFPGGDNTVGMTGWKPITVNVPIAQGPGTYEILIQDAGDDIYDSVVLIDNIRFK